MFSGDSDPNEREKLGHSWDPQNRVVSEVESYSFLCGQDIGRKENQAMSKQVSKTPTMITEYAMQFQLGHWCFCGLGQERECGYRASWDKPAGEWNQIARKMSQRSCTSNVLWC